MLNSAGWSNFNQGGEIEELFPFNSPRLFREFDLTDLLGILLSCKLHSIDSFNRAVISSLLNWNQLFNSYVLYLLFIWKNFYSSHIFFLLINPEILPFVCQLVRGLSASRFYFSRVTLKRRAKARPRITRNVAHHFAENGNSLKLEKAKVMRERTLGACESAQSKQVWVCKCGEKFTRDSRELEQTADESSRMWFTKSPAILRTLTRAREKARG